MRWNERQEQPVSDEAVAETPEKIEEAFDELPSEDDE